MDPLYINIEKDTLNNTDYRNVLYTTEQNQVVLMSLNQGEDIPEEIHPTTTQFIGIESGKGLAVINDKEYELTDGISLDIPAGAKHYISNTDDKPLKLYTVYSPPEHDDGLVQSRQKNYIRSLPNNVLRLTYGYLDDVSLAHACMINPEMTKRICNNTLWINKISKKFNMSRYEMDQYKGKNTYWAYYDYLSRIVDNNRSNDILFNGSGIGRLDLVLIALNKGVNDRDLNSALLISSKHGYPDIVKLMLDRGANINYRGQFSDNTALILASANGHIDIVRLLLDKGADVHAANEYALRLASTNGHIDIVRLLLDKGADVHAYGDDAQRRAIISGHKDVIELLNKYK